MSPLSKTERLDVLVVEAGLAESREDAQRLIRAGTILVREERIDKPGRKVDRMFPIRCTMADRRFVGRGGEKLDAVLECWGINAAGAVCLDLGSSTGGFCDCLLQRGALRIHAVDVGAAQLHEKIRRDSRVVTHEGVNARFLTPEAIGERVDVVTADVSFISLRLVLLPVRPLMKESGQAIVLVKPQFEIGKGRVGKGGIVRNPDDHREVLLNFTSWAFDEGWGIGGILSSPLEGREGNREFFIRLELKAESGLDKDSITLEIEKCLEIDKKT